MSEIYQKLVRTDEHENLPLLVTPEVQPIG